MKESKELQAVLDEYERGGDFAADWSRAQTEADSRKTRFAWAVPVLAAAAVMMWLGVQLVPESTTEEPHVQATSSRSTDGRLKLGLGHGGYLELGAKPLSIDVVDPEVAAVSPVDDSRVWVRGLETGNTDVVVDFGEHQEVHAIRVVDKALSPDSSGWVDVELAGHLVWKGPEVSAVSIVDPSILAANNSSNGIRFLGLETGSTDVRIHHEDGVDVFSVVVGGSGRSTDQLYAPETTPVDLRKGQAAKIQVELTQARTISVADPSVLTVTPTQKHLLLKAVGVGETDLEIQLSDGTSKHLRVHVRN